MPRILILDIETFPNVAHVWRFYKENVGAKQVVEHATLASFAYKWYGEDGVGYFDIQHQSEKKLLKELIALLDLADIVIAHNGAKFDLPTIQGRAMVAGLRPPSPYKIIDTLLVAKYEFNFPANSLEYLVIILECAPKGGHKQFPGFELWEQCMKNNPEAWAEMRVYNMQDVTTLEEVYNKMKPWMRRHPNLAVFEEDNEIMCPKCGSKHIQWRGYTTTNVGKYKKFQCQGCGGWSRTRYSEYPIDKKHALLVNTN